MHRKIGVAMLLTLAAALVAQEPDNTKKNERDRKVGAVTADQQKESPADRALTQKIRKAVVDADGMSTYGKNVKIVSRDGKVTLRGPVNNQEEKGKIEELAKTIAGESNVVNELEIKGVKQ
ncbi:MAG TPA: BON domain-containing protein [Bryobacteraceae bacterium]|nr:BON domain-containing protein [Bryobacteraceae bacterium]